MEGWLCGYLLRASPQDSCNWRETCRAEHEHMHARQLQREAEPCLNCANIFAAAIIVP